MEIPSVLRLEEHKALAKLTLNGTVLDIGGDKRATYQKLIKGNHTLTTVNLDPKSSPDVFHDLEKPLPLKDISYDNILLINVLEHIFNYRELIAESVRVLKSGGTLVVVVPFLFPVHPSPYDFHRFTEAALQKELANSGLANIKVQALGKGVFTARYLLIDRLMPAPIRFLCSYTVRYWVYFLDFLFARLSKVLGKKYKIEDYALGYCVTAQKAL